MEYLNYLIYPIAGLLCFLALGGFNNNHRGVVISSMVSLALNGYAIIEFVWWPIPISIASDFLFKKILGDPGARPRAVDCTRRCTDIYPGYGGHATKLRGSLI